MGLLDMARGNASETDRANGEKVFGPLLTKGETVTHVYRVGVRDLLIFTTRRLVFLDKMGPTGKKLSIASYPWYMLMNWNITTAVLFDLEAELVMQFRGPEEPLRFDFGRGTDIRPVAQAVSALAFGSARPC
jgi:Bacterial PH domain